MQIPDHTYLSYLDCPRRFEYRMVRHLDAREPSPELHAGRCGHAALDAWYLNDRNDAEALDALAGAWGEYEPPTGHRRAYLTLGHTQKALRQYFDWWRVRDPLNPLKTDCQDDMQLTNETPVIAEIADGIMYGGVPDMPYRLGEYVYVCDHKFTCSYIGTDLGFYDFHDQLRGYVLLLRARLGIEIAGALVNLIYIGESQSPHREPYDNKRGSIVRWSRYGPIHFSPAQLEETKRNIEAKLAVIEHYSERGYWPQHTSRNCNWCQYAPLCRISPLIRERKMSEWYIERPWDFQKRDARVEHAQM